MSNTESKELVNRLEPAPQPRASALVQMATRLNLDPDKMLATLKATVFKGASNEELAALTVVANEYRMNPFLKELYAFPAKGGGVVPVVSIDGWVSLMNRHADFDGIEFEHVDSPDGKPVSCTAVIHHKRRSKPLRVTEYFSECSRNTDPWNKSPRRMLRHKALIQGARVAFGFSGIQDEDEGRDTAAGERPANAREVRKSFDLGPVRAFEPVPHSPAALSARIDAETMIRDACDAVPVNVTEFIRGAVGQGVIEPPHDLTLSACTDAQIEALASVIPNLTGGSGK